MSFRGQASWAKMTSLGGKLTPQVCHPTKIVNKAVVGWHTSGVSLSPGDVILAQLACPLNDIILVYIGNI
jgi:hypothetical protein